jgi:MYXO-CTERM domain-containing protein
MQSNNLLTVTALALASAALAPVAHAHINMVGDFVGRDGDQKDVPCDGKRGDGPIYELEPGATITLTVNETVGHPSYYRVAFDADGEDFVDPRSIRPIEGYSRKCPWDSTDLCGEPDFCNNTDKGQVVLWDNLDEHVRGLFERSTAKWNIKLPDVECDNCTIQVLQVMQDADAHGGYCPFDIDKCNVPGAIQDNYHRCIDIKLVKGAKKIPGVTTDAAKNKGMECLAEVVTPTEPQKDASTPPDEPVTTPPEGKSDASTGSSPRDAGSDDAVDDNAGDDGETDDTSEASSGSIKRDASTVGKDAGKSGSSGVKKDAGSAEATSTGAGDDGCAVATPSSEGAAWTLLLLGWLLARRRSAAKAS